ncbi:hypothetical protein BH20ACT6_BH20ACT6_12100 [soil metagenome]
MAYDVSALDARRRAVLSTGLLLLAATIVLGWLVTSGWQPLRDLDADLARAAYDRVVGHDRLVRGLELLSLVSEPTVVRVGLLAVAVSAVVRGRARVGVWLAASVLVATVLAPLAKAVLDRPRPSWAEPITSVSGLSFPSGHSAGAGLLVATAVLLTHMSVASRVRRRLFDVGWVLLGVLIGLDRILLGVHYTSDVLAGWALGALIPMLLAVAIVPWQPPATGPAPTSTGQRPSRLAVVLNPTKVDDTTGFRQLVRDAAARHGWQPPSFYETAADDPGTAMSEAALASGTDMVVAAGGDGTVRVVCAELARTGVPVGIVPLGTGNLLARNLHLPLRPAEAVDVALSGQDRAIDVVEVSGDGLPETAFTVMGGLGFDAAVMAGASEALKAQLGWRAYVVSALRNVGYPASRVEVSVDDGPFVRHRARTVVVGNVGLLQAGIPLLPDARFDDGRLDVVVVAPQQVWGWVAVVIRVLRRGRGTDAQLARMTGSTVIVRTGHPQARQLDGDPIGAGRELRCRVLAGTLLVRVPR